MMMQGALTVLLLTGTVHAQSLFLEPASPVQSPDENPAQELQGHSLFVVAPPPPREFAKHDIIEIIISEQTNLKVEQSFESTKDYSLAAALTEFPSLRQLLELQLRNGDNTPIVTVDASATKDFTGEGERETKERFTARIAATVLEVKPNGNLVLEAKKIVETDGETQTLVLAGVCREVDVSAENSVLSGQIANLTIRMSHEGDVNDAAQKGIIARVLDAIFAF